MLVANHSAGMAIAELASFAALWTEAHGDERALAGFAHPVSFWLWPLTFVSKHLGLVPSTYEAAYETLEDEIPLLVFPGGDHDTLRPIWKANEVDFGGRKGFLNIAARTGVPIVPMGIRGSHYTAPMLLRSRLFAWLFVIPRLVGIKRWGISVLSMVGGIGIYFLPVALTLKIVIALLFLGSPLVFLPWVPWTIRFRIGEPIAARELLGNLDAPELDEALARIENEVEHLVREES